MPGLPGRGAGRPGCRRCAAALDEQPSGPATGRSRSFLDRPTRTPLAELQRTYVDAFDLSRKHALYLSYWTDGDTRRRGEVLAAFKQRYRDSGFLVDTRGELPDFLPLVLEFAAIADPDDGRLLQAVPAEHRAAPARADARPPAPYADVAGGRLRDPAGRFPG